jgi:transglutaminase-like putative cysteine protease
MFAAFFMLFLVACSKDTADTKDPSNTDADSEVSISAQAEEIPLASGLPASDMNAVPAGTFVKSNDKILLDYSNTSSGYIMVKYTGTNPKVKTQITGPSGVTYTYNQSLTGDYDVYVLSDGSGSYSITVYENTSGTSYAKAFSFNFDVALQDEFAPFLHSNKYVNYNESSKVVSVAANLCKDKQTTNDKIKAVYDYVISNISYDYNLAKNVSSGYIPNLDSVLTNKTGICFDYAATMTAMLRSQGIPTKMIFGYTGSVYHAWISTYSEESGWVTAAIYFNGEEWKLMDPTFASSGKSSKQIMEYIGNGANYVAKYLY